LSRAVRADDVVTAGVLLAYRRVARPRAQVESLAGLDERVAVGGEHVGQPKQIRSSSNRPSCPPSQQRAMR